MEEEERGPCGARLGVNGAEGWPEGPATAGADGTPAVQAAPSSSLLPPSGSLGLVGTACWGQGAQPGPCYKVGER